MFQHQLAECSGTWFAAKWPTHGLPIFSDVLACRSLLNPHTGPLQARAELLADEVLVCLGQDHISDAYYPFDVLARRSPAAKIPFQTRRGKAPLTLSSGDTTYPVPSIQFTAEGQDYERAAKHRSRHRAF